jgi:hypothetical protein
LNPNCNPSPTCLLQDLIEVLDALLVLNLADDLDVPDGTGQGRTGQPNATGK